MNYKTTHNCTPPPKYFEAINIVITNAKYKFDQTSFVDAMPSNHHEVL